MYGLCFDSRLLKYEDGVNIKKLIKKLIVPLTLALSHKGRGEVREFPFLREYEG